MLLLRGFLGLARQDADAGAGVVIAWSLLERAQGVAPQAVEEILMTPGTGIWVTSVLRQLQGDKSARPLPLRVAAGRLSAMAIAAATRARLSFSLEVPIQWGIVSLPGLGCVRFEERRRRAWAIGRASGQGGSLRIVDAAGAEVRTGPDWRHHVPGWSPTCRLTVGRRGDALDLVLDEHDPCRNFSTPQEPRLLSGEEKEAWRLVLTEAWNILTRDDSEVAEEIRRGPLLSIAPVEAREEFRPYSSSAGEAFGGISASLPDTSLQFAATLVHEFQHIKLGALIHLESLARRLESPKDRLELFYAPWRDDPRPLEGLIQGFYAFFGVARFWRAHRRKSEGSGSLLADFEFALCRDQVWSVLTGLRRHHRLTAAGRQLVDLVIEHCDAWRAEEVSRTGMRLARDAIVDHSARWRAHHLRPDVRAVDETVRAWRRGDALPPVSLGAPPRTVPDAQAVSLDVAATLARHVITDSTGEWASRAEAKVGGATRADVLLALGERPAARRGLLEQMETQDPPAASWALLGRALADDPVHHEAARFLLRFPERARAVQEALTAAGVRPSDPLRLATWLANGG
ncbi:HEXXH motif domain-containing protein [Streptomyces sp. NPDC051576]|uniref:HEXXH motif domain-containing protein n=1 Tax=Streptomyces sp. NPDC051576 TaxID=3155803 RepID=UPI00342C39E6